MKKARFIFLFTCVATLAAFALTGCSGTDAADTTSAVSASGSSASSASQSESTESATSSHLLTEVQEGTYTKADVDWPDLEARDTGADSPYGYFSIANILSLYNTDSTDGTQDLLTDSVGLDMVISEDNTVTIYELNSETGEIMENTMSCTIADEPNDDGLLEISFTYEGTDALHTVFYSPEYQSLTEYTEDLVYIFVKNVPAEE